MPKKDSIYVDPIGCGEDWPGPGWCGRWHMARLQLCDSCLEKYEKEYPQGWRAYPGDVCRHGVYVGGCGADYMCGYCESGEEPDPPEEDYGDTCKLHGMHIKDCAYVCDYCCRYQVLVQLPDRSNHVALDTNDYDEAVAEAEDWTRRGAEVDLIDWVAEEATRGYTAARSCGD